MCYIVRHQNYDNTAFYHFFQKKNFTLNNFSTYIVQIEIWYTKLGHFKF